MKRNLRSASDTNMIQLAVRLKPPIQPLDGDAAVFGVLATRFLDSG